MRVQCPNANHPINVSDDFTGTQIRCPQCKVIIFLDRKPREKSAEQIQEGEPVSSASKDVDNLAEQIYDGLPPLSVMLALGRQGRTYDADDILQKLEMTPDDWKALAAFESLLRASFALRSTLAVGSVVLAIDVLAWIAIASNLGETSPARSMVDRLGAAAGLAVLPCFLILLLGSAALQRARLGGVVDFLLGATSCALLLYAGFAGTVACEVMYLSPHRYSDGAQLVCLIASAGSLVVVFALVHATWRTARALKQIQPPEITNRVVEALKYLE